MPVKFAAILCPQYQIWDHTIAKRLFGPGLILWFRYVDQQCKRHFGHGSIRGEVQTRPMLWIGCVDVILQGCFFAHPEAERVHVHFLVGQIQEELGNGETIDIKELKKKAARLKWSKGIQKAFDKELAKLERMNSMAPDYSVQMNYLEFMTDLPWSLYSTDQFDLQRARKILDRDHFGLEKVKERILEHLAVLKLRGDMRSPILS